MPLTLHIHVDGETWIVKNPKFFQKGFNVTTFLLHLKKVGPSFHDINV
jgi:hypothetical protein